MRIFRKLHRQTADLKLRLIPELRSLTREQRWAQWSQCYDLVACDRNIRSLRNVRDHCPVLGLLVGTALGFWTAGVPGSMIGLVTGACIGGAMGGVIHGLAFRSKARLYLQRSVFER